MGLFKHLSLQQLWQSASQTYLRFPLVLLSALTGTVTLLILTELNNKLQEQYPWLIKLVLISAIGLILFFTLELLVCRYKLSKKTRFILWLSGLVFLALYFTLLPKEMEFPHIIRFLATLLMFHLMASYAMFLNLRQENAFWQFNKALFLRILTSVLYSGVLYIGLVVAIVALDQLFSVDIDDNIYFQLWIVIVGVFNTWFFLAGVPTDVEDLEQTHTYPKGLKVFTQFVLLPLVTVYLLILYAYFGKIIMQWEWPEGWVSILVLCFSIAGILSLLLIHPIRNEEGNTWIRSFSKWFYRALFPLIILFALAIWRRVSEYGITEERYVVLALAFWLLITVLYFLFSRKKNIKFIPVTLSFIALIAAFSPVNMFVISEWSQVSRLRNLLQEQDIMVDGKVDPSHGPVEKEALAEISAITEYLSEYHGFDALEGWFATDLHAALDTVDEENSSKWSARMEKRDLVLDMFGVEYTTIDKRSSGTYYNFMLQEYDAKPEVYAVGEYDYVVEVLFREDERHELKLGNMPLIMSLEEHVVSFQLEQETLQLDLIPIIKKLNKKKGDSIRSRTEMTYTLKGKTAKIQLIIQELYGNQKDNEYDTGSLGLLVLVDEH